MTRPFNGQLMDVRSAAALLGCSEKAIRARVSRHLLPYRKLSGRVVFLRSELEAYIATLPGVSVEEAQANVAMRSGDMVRR